MKIKTIADKKSSPPFLDGKKWGKTFYLIPLLIGLIVLAFAPSLLDGFTNWDDENHLLNNPLVRSLAPDNLTKIFTTSIHRIYIPLSILSYAIEYHFFGMKPWVFHLDNLLLHIGVTVLVFLLARWLGLKERAAFLAALIFGVHPLRVESVVWITERKDVLYGFFYLLAVYNYTRYLDTKEKKFYGLSLVGGALSILAKPMAVSLPLILLLCCWWKERKFTKATLVTIVPYLLYMIPIAAITYLQLARTFHANLGQAILIWIWTFIFYLRKFVFPFPLVPLYNLPLPVSFVQPTYIVVLIAFLLLGIAVIFFRRHRLFIFAIGYYVLSIFFLLRFDNSTDINIVADRFMYLPSVGLCIWLAQAWESCYEHFGNFNKNFQRYAVILVGIFIIFGLMVKTFLQCQIWKDSPSLWNYVLRYTPHTIAFNNRGEAYLGKGKHPEAIADFRMAIALNPKNDSAYNNLGQALFNLGQYPEALVEFNQAIALNPQSHGAYNNRGNLYREWDQLDQAIADYSRALQSNPYCFQAMINRGNVLCMLTRYEEARKNFTASLVLDPENADAHFGVAMTYLLAKSNFDLAIASFSHAITLRPNYPQAYFYRAQAYKNQGNDFLADKDVQQAKKLGFKE